MIRRFALFFGIAALLASAALRDSFDRWIAATDLPVLLAPISTEVRDRRGDLLRAYTVGNGIWRFDVTPQAVDQTYLNMLIAYEDKRFYQHQGVDGRALMRAVVQAIGSGRIVSGGSTLTMQVARLLEDSGTGRWRGKLRQIRVALALEQTLTKPEILQLYLTHAPFGGNIEGVRAATLSWFGKEPRRMTPAQAAFLIALPQSPEARRPDRHPIQSEHARNLVLQRLAASNVISNSDLQAGYSEPVPTQRRPFPKFAAHMADRAIAADPTLTIHALTLDKPLQTALESLATQSLLDKEDRLSIAIMVADHTTGEILASIGSKGYGTADQRQGYIDMTQAIRSPGSTLKPLIYAMAFDQGLAHPETLIHDQPISINGYAPHNFDGRFRGELRIADALRQSLNIPVVLLTHELGPARLLATLNAAGITARRPAGPAGLAIALGGLGLSLQDLVQLYAMQANLGKSRPLVWRAKDHNSVVPQQILRRSSAWHVNHILSEMPPPQGAPHNRLAYKTGTSYGHRDAWAIGYDGTHVIGIWIGRADGTPVPGAFGGNIAAPILFQAFQRVKPSLTPLPPPPPETLMVSATALPLPLRRFKPRTAVFAKSGTAPTVDFPPNGAILDRLPEGVLVKIREGKRPFTILVNGKPVKTNLQRRQFVLAYTEKGAATFTVIDANGQSDRVAFWLQ